MIPRRNILSTLLNCVHCFFSGIEELIYTLRQLAARVSRRYLAGMMILATMAALTWFCIRFNSSPSASVGIAPKAQLVSIARPDHRLLHVTATLAGVWIAREEVVIGSPLEGMRVAEVLVESGDRVVSGQLLARLEHSVLDSQTRQADQAVRRARAEFIHANGQYQRAQQLMPAGAVSHQDFETARATMLAAQAALQQAEAASEEQQTRRDHAQIRAPFAGTITKRSVQMGAMAGTQTALFHLSGEQPPEFLVQVPQQLLPDLVTGMKAQISTSGRDGVQSGSLRLISPVVDASTGYGQSRIAILEPSPASIRPGMAGSARIEIVARDVLALDARAVRFGATPYVFVVDGGHARSTPVQIGLRQEGWVEIVAGVDTTSRVVISEASLLQDGDPVTVRDTDPIAAFTERQAISLLYQLCNRLPWPQRHLLTATTVGSKA